MKTLAGRERGQCAVAALAIVAAFALSARAELPVPALRARVTDLAGLLPSDRASALEAALAAYERETGHQIAVLTVETTGGEAIESFALRVAEAWKLGRAGADDGALLVVAAKDRTTRIEVGYGLEGAIPDAIAKRIIEEAMLPRFREGDFAGGLEAATEWMMRAARGEALPTAAPASRGAPDLDPVACVAFLAVLSSLVGAPFRRRLRPLGALAGGTIAAAVVWFLLHAAAWSAIAFLLGAFFGWAGPNLGALDARRGGFGRGGFGGGFGGIGGGFGGGGGSFGGGGASGRW